MARIRVDEHVEAALNHLQERWSAEGSSFTVPMIVEHALFNFLRDYQQRDEAAREAFEILAAANFVKKLRADYERAVAGVR